MTSKEQDFKQRFIEVLRDLQQDGVKDRTAMAALGALGTILAKELKSTTWSGAKKNITTPLYQKLLEKLHTSGDEHHSAGRRNEAYVIQILAYSLVARTQVRDPQIAQGEALLDAAIDRAIAAHQQATQAQAT